MAGSNPQLVIGGLLENALGAAQDNLARAQMTFKRYSEASMNKPYGSSTETPKQILAEYQAQKAELLNALRWLAEQEGK